MGAVGAAAPTIIWQWVPGANNVFCTRNMEQKPLFASTITPNYNPMSTTKLGYFAICHGMTRRKRCSKERQKY